MKLKVKIGWVFICPIMILNGDVIPRRLSYKYLYYVSKWIMNLATICLYLIGFNKLTRNPFLRITGDRDIIIED